MGQSYNLTLSLGLRLGRELQHEPYSTTTSSIGSYFSQNTITWTHEGQLVSLQSHLERQLANMNITSRSTSSSAPGNLPLAGVRVLEMGQLIAGPFGGQLLGYAKPVTN